jgi:hypothetical protein
MDATQSQIKIHGIASQTAEDFAFDHDTSSDSDDLFTELVPDLDNWGGVGWMELTSFEYDGTRQIMNLMVETKWASPVEWLRNASIGSHYFENKLITMTTIQKDETVVTASAVMDGEILQNKYIFEMPSEEVGKYYNDDISDYNLDNLDNQIWDSIAKFVTVCEQFYLEGDKEND